MCSSRSPRRWCPVIPAAPLPSLVSWLAKLSPVESIYFLWPARRLPPAALVCLFRVNSFVLHFSQTREPLDSTDHENLRRQLEHVLQNISPHARQWCFRLNRVNSALQLTHACRSLSGICTPGPGSFVSSLLARSSRSRFTGAVCGGEVVSVLADGVGRVGCVGGVSCIRTFLAWALHSSKAGDCDAVSTMFEVTSSDDGNKPACAENRDGDASSCGSGDFLQLVVSVVLGGDLGERKMSSKQTISSAQTRCRLQAWNESRITPN